MSKYAIHQDFKKLENNKLPLYPTLLPILNKLVARKNKKMELPTIIQLSKIQIDGFRSESIDLFMYEPEGIGSNAPCLIYFHGGAFAIKEAPYHINLVCDYALKTPCKVLFVDYRLLPKHPFPVGVEDGYAACKWLYSNAEKFDVDVNKIAVGGDSAGGALAAAMTHMARDRRDFTICFQMLNYPVTDARQNTASMNKYTDTPMWNAKLNEKMWRLYLKDGVNGQRGYASPMEASSFDDLPHAYVEVAEFDCLRDEGINYAEALKSNGIEVELNITKGTVHGYDMVESSNIVMENKSRRIKALQRAFQINHV